MNFSVNFARSQHDDESPCEEFDSECKEAVGDDNDDIIGDSNHLQWTSCPRYFFFLTDLIHDF